MAAVPPERIISNRRWKCKAEPDAENRVEVEIRTREKRIIEEGTNSGLVSRLLFSVFG